MVEKKQITLWQDGEYDYPMAQGFVPNIMAYLHKADPENIRPCVIVVPGGAYCFISPSEGELPAKKFFEFGYNTFVLTYTVNPVYAYPLNDQPMKDLSRAIRYVRANHEALGIDPDKVAVCGFSAGGHLCGSVCVHHGNVSDANPIYRDISNKPDAAILSYPVITAGEYSHQGSFDALLGFNAPKELREYYSLERQVNKDVPPCFLWQTATDETVPVENSYLFAKALREQGIPCSHHVFSEGKHGLSTADEAFGRSEFGEMYTIIQTLRVTEAIRNGTVQVPDKVREMMEYWEEQGIPKIEANEEVAIWTEMVRVWLAKYM